MADPSDLAAYRRHAEWAVVAATALELGVYDALARGPASPGTLAERLGLDPRGLRILLGSLEALGLVAAEDGLYRLTGAARARLLDRDTPDYERDVLEFWLRNIRLWTRRLPEAVRSGRPVEEEGDGAEEAAGEGAARGEGDRADGRGGDADEEHLARFMAAMAGKNPDLVEALVGECLRRRPEAGTMLDLGGGPGTFARAFADRGLRATLFDRPKVIDHVAERYGLAKRPDITLRAGDFLEDPPAGAFDIVLLANITHIYDGPTNARLLEEVGAAVAPGGLLAILDFVRGRGAFASLFAVTMLVNTERGDTHGLPEYRSWLEGAGLRDVRCRDLPEERQLVTATRRATA